MGVQGSHVCRPWRNLQGCDKSGRHFGKDLNCDVSMKTRTIFIILTNVYSDLTCLHESSPTCRMYTILRVFFIDIQKMIYYTHCRSVSPPIKCA